MANDLAFNVVALDRASQTFLKLAETVEIVQKKVEQLDGKNANVDVNVRTDASRRALDSFTTRFQLMAAGIIAGSPAIGAAVIGGIGAGFIGVAVLAQKSNEDVKQTYTNLWQNVVQSTRSGTNQIVPEIVGAGRIIDAEMQRLGPSMKAGFAAAGPDIISLTNAVTGFARNAMPGVTSAMQNSLPVFVGVETAADTLGTAFGTSVASMGQNAQSYGAFMTSLGVITSSVLTAGVQIINDVAQAWASNGAEIDGVIQNTTQIIASLADGALPVLNFALHAAATALKVVTDLLGPLAPVIGTVAAGALALWGAFKLAELATIAVKALAGGVLTLGAGMEAGAARTATMMASLEGVSVQSSVAATAVRTAGTAAATASVNFASAAASMAGPLGIALVAGTLLMGSLASSESEASAKTADLKAKTDELTSALIKNHGAVNQQIIDQFQGSGAFKEAAANAGKLGISQADLTEAIMSGGPALDALKAKLDQSVQAGGAAINSHDRNAKATVENAKAAGALKDALGDLINQWSSVRTNADNASASENKQALALQASKDGQEATTRAAAALGLSLEYVSMMFRASAIAGGASGQTVQQVSAAYLKSALQIANAAAAITDHFKQVDKSVASAQGAVEDAEHSVAQASRSVADAQHSEAQAARAVSDAQQGVAAAAHGVVTAQRAVRDAVDGVSSAQRAYTQAQEQARQAEVSLSEARQQAIRDLKALHLQLEDQNVTEASARVRLFDAREAAKTFGITDASASRVANQTVTTQNEPEIKAALDLLSAQNALNNAINSGKNLREDVAKADAAGVNGARGVVSAQQSLRSAQDQVTSSLKGIQKAQEQLADASYGLQQAQRGLQRAHQAVEDAAYSERRAHEAVTDAQYQSSRAANALRVAKQNLADAHDNASRSLDINTAAGRQNLQLMLQLWDSINNSGLSTNQKYNTAISQVADAFGVSKDRAADYLKQLGLIPQDFKYDVTAVASVDTAGLAQVFKGTSAGGYFNDSMNQKKTIGGTGYASGGPVYGPGGPKDDLVDARLSPGEFVHQAEAVDFYGVGFMKAVNERKLPRFASGGLVHWNALGAGA
ncbi:hypothetical protein, partial [Amycolatopsis kentuckyensis]|uniref:hypothetical protein n=1 Tax=Amycolatopsis kentuckyensis TaxID=218823 RepID=UPI00117831B7